MGVDLVDGGRRVLNAFRHQREGQYFASDIHENIVECSTPFGINARGSCLRRRWDCPRSCAQRLSASTRGAASTNSITKYGVPCAQRLSASTRGAEGLADAQPIQITRVLNAFRHQREGQGKCRHMHGRIERCSTPFGINARGRRPWPSKCSRLSECSTPFGINARGSTVAVSSNSK